MRRVAAESSGVATAAAPAVRPARLFGLDVGDWSMLFFGLAAAAVLLALV